MATLGPLGWAQAPAAPAPAPAADPVAWQPDQLEALAASGQFDILLDRLSDADAAPDDDSQGLIDALRRYADNQAARDASRRGAFDEALANAHDALAESKVEEALVYAIDAHSQDGTDAFLLRPEIAALAGEARTRATQAEADGDWIEAVTLYRLLDLLYEVDARFSDDLARAIEHVRVLSMYAPQRFGELQAARLAELGETVDEGGIDPDPERWQDRLAGIDRAVLERSMKDSIDHQINSPDFATMLAGGIEQLLVLARTPEAAESFARLADAQTRDPFIQRLVTIQAELNAAGVNLTPRQIANRIALIGSLNQMTVRLPEEVLYYELTEGATDTLDDYTYVIWPVDTKEFLERTLLGKIYGVGVQIAREDGLLTVITPIANTPAQRAGLRPGDVIEQVNGVATAAWSLTRAVREITGEEGTPVNLGVRRVGADDLIQVTLIRAEIPIDSVRGWEHLPNGDGNEWDFWVDPDLGIGYVRLTQFVEQTVVDLDAAIAQMQAERPVQGLILDLRFNPGGLMESAVEVVDRLVDEGTIVAQVDADGRLQRGSVREARAGNTYRDFPVVVLVNEGSASASEIVAGALQDYGRAVTIGENSFGKGSVQQVGWFPSRFDPQWGVRITTSHYTLPSGRVIHREEDSTEWGVAPDLAIDMTERQIVAMMEYRREADVLRESDEEPVPASALLDEGLDPQLEAALLVLKTDLLAERLDLAMGRDATQ